MYDGWDKHGTLFVHILKLGSTGFERKQRHWELHDLGTFFDVIL